MAERGGFEPPIPVKVCPLSRRIVSTAHAPLRVEKMLATTPRASLLICETGPSVQGLSEQHSLTVACEKISVEFRRNGPPALRLVRPSDDSVADGSAPA